MRSVEQGDGILPAPADHTGSFKSSRERALLGAGPWEALVTGDVTGEPLAIGHISLQQQNHEEGLRELCHRRDGRGGVARNTV